MKGEPRFGCELLGERWGRTKGEQLAVQIPPAGVDAITEKIVRGLVYREDGRFIEAPYEISTYLDGAGAEVAREMLQRAGKEYKREPCLKIRRATVDGDEQTAIYAITFWQQFKTYATIQKMGNGRHDFPQGYRALDRNELVEAGDLWCHHVRSSECGSPPSVLENRSRTTTIAEWLPPLILRRGRIGMLEAFSPSFLRE